MGLGSLETKPAVVISWEIISNNTSLENLKLLKEYLCGEIAHHPSELLAHFSQGCELLQCIHVVCCGTSLLSTFSCIVDWPGGGY